MSFVQGTLYQKDREILVVTQMNILYIIHDNKKGGAAVSFLNMIEGVN